MNRHEDAAARFARAIELDPSLAQAQVNLALARRSLGEYAAVWPDYEALWRNRFCCTSSRASAPARFAPVRQPRRRRDAGAAGRGARGFRFPCPPAQPAARVPDHARNDSRRCALSPRAAGVRRLFNGLCWAGNPGNPTDRECSIPLRALTPPLEIPGARFVSLQKALRRGDEEILARFPNIDVDRIRACADFADTAALVADLDLIIAVDTSLAHLAGALARPVWVLLKFSAHGAWLRDREDSPGIPPPAS